MREIQQREEARAATNSRAPLILGLEFFNKPADDLRRQNLPIVSEVAALFDTDDGAPPSSRSSRVYPHRQGPSTLSYTSMHIDCI